MTNFYDRPLALVPAPREIKLSGRSWTPPARGVVVESADGRAWALARDARTARRLLARAPARRHRHPEAYALTTVPGGAAASASHPAGARHARATLRQLGLLAAGGDLPCAEIQDAPDLDIRGIHLDLKYMMHRRDYLLRWLEQLAGWKINTLLLEYEDKFPYARHPVLRHPAAFTEGDLRAFLAHARALGLRVIPLIQTLGHVEYILKHDEFAPLRRDGAHTEYDARHAEVWPFVRDMLDEVLAYHNEDDWFHIGGDECWFLGHEPASTRARLYSRHMGRVLRHIVERGKRPLMWEDMLRSLPDRDRAVVMRALPPDTILCYWNYDSTPRAAVRGERLAKIAAPRRSKGFDRPEAWAAYRRAGFDVIGIPCHDWGPIIPYYARYTAPNTLAMIQDTVRYDGPGVINSHWASFHCPLPLQDYGIALTADRSWHLAARADISDFDDAYARLVFGLPHRVVIDALRQMDIMLEMPSNLGRGLHMPYYYYMDSVLHYPDGHLGRVKYGASGEPGQIDFAAIARKKLSHLAKSDRRAATLAGLRAVRDQAAAAAVMLRAVRRDVRRGRDLFRLIAWLADFRRHAAERMLTLAARRPAAERRRQAVAGDRVRRAMRGAYGWFLDPHDYRYEDAALFEGETALLRRRGR